MLDQAPAPGADVHAAAVRLLGFLRDLAGARREPARDLGAYEQVCWLAELPAEVYLETDAGPGEVLFSIPVIPLSPPTVLEEFDGWIGLRHWYRTLRDLAGAEVVLATGLLSWQPPDGEGVHDHLLTTPVRIVVDERTERVDVVLAGHTSLRDWDLLGGLGGFRPARTDWVWDAVRAGQGFALRASVSDVLRKWCSIAFTEFGAVFREDWTPAQAPPGAPQLRLAPALVVRPPGRAALSDHYDDLLAQLSRMTEVPGGLGRLIEPERSARLLQVAERSPQAVADLLAGLLARGRRVLVTTPDAERVLAALPGDVAGLCALTEEAPVVDRLRARAFEHDPAGHRRYVEELTERRTSADREVSELGERLALTEATDACDLGPGYRGSRAELTRRLRAESHPWLTPDPGMPVDPPLKASEVAELVTLIGEETPGRRARTWQRDVDPGALPSAPYVRSLIEAEAAEVERAARSQTDLSRRLRDLDVALLARLEAAARAVDAALHDLGLDGHPSEWDPTDHAARAFTDALAGRRPTVWARVAEMAPQAEWAEHALASLGGRRVQLPPGELHLRRLASAAQDLRNHLSEGGSLKRGPLRSVAQRQAEPLLTGARVDGKPPTTPELLDAVFSVLMVRMSLQELEYVWEAAGMPFDDGPLDERVAAFRRAHLRLARIREVMPAIEESAGHLAGLGIPITHPLQWHGYVVGLQSALSELSVNRASADLNALRDSISTDHKGQPPELLAALVAIDSRDADGYARSLTALQEVRHERALQVRCEALLERVRAAHPELAESLIGGTVPEQWNQAWAWAHASARLAELPVSPAEDRLRESLAAAEERQAEVSAELSTAEAWEACLSRSEAPAWIAPLWHVPELLPAVPDSFDVVIVDGEHGAGAEALFLMWLAPRAILIGEGGPELPHPEGTIDLIPDVLDGAVTPTAPLFEILRARFAAAERPAPVGAASARVAPAPEAHPQSQPQSQSNVPQPHVPQQGAAQQAAAQQGAAQRAAPERGDPPPALSIERGRSIVAYKRPQLVELIQRIDAGEPGLSDEDLVERAGQILGCPDDEALLVSARLHYAVETFREPSETA